MGGHDGRSADEIARNIAARRAEMSALADTLEERLASRHHQQARPHGLEAGHDLVLRTKEDVLRGANLVDDTPHQDGHAVGQGEYVLPPAIAARLVEHVRRWGQTLFHPVSTCAMSLASAVA